MISKQLQFLKNCIDTEEYGILREIIKKAVQDAPNKDLLTIAHCLYQIGLDLSIDYGLQDARERGHTIQSQE